MSELEITEREGNSGWMVNHLPVMLWQRRYLVLACLVTLSLAG